MINIGDMYGRFFWSLITTDFCGIMANIGIDETDDGIVSKAFAVTIGIGYFAFSVGWVIRWS